VTAYSSPNFGTAFPDPDDSTRALILRDHRRGRQEAT
jgi:hypothetical protein